MFTAFSKGIIIMSIQDVDDELEDMMAKFNNHWSETKNLMPVLTLWGNF